jgi:transcriptional regulator with XRE-family HTH domain
MRPKSPSPIDKHVGSQIRLHRKMIGMSQTALADRLGITFQQIQKYEKGTNRVGASRIQGIASILGIKVSVLFPTSQSGSDHEATANKEGLAIETFAASTEGFALNQAFTQIKNVDVRKRVVALVCAMAEARDVSKD